MRTIALPMVPPPNTYDEAAQLKVEVDVELLKPVTLKRHVERSDKQEVVRQQTALINQWIVAGCPLVSNSPVFADKADKSNYGERLDALGKGGSNWGDARGALIGLIGQYCSYCESPIRSQLDIEHRLPKSTFPERALAWDNFLLSCATCNSAKSNSPNQGTIPGHPVSTAAAEQYILNQTGAHYLWPDFDWSTLPTPSPLPFKPTLAWIAANTGSLQFTYAVDDNAKQRLRSLYASGGLGVDRGLYYEPTGMGGKYKHFFGVLLEPVDGAARAVIDLVSLNRVVRTENSSKSVDRRIFNRTTVWFRAHELLAQLYAGATSFPLANDLNAALLDQAQDTIRWSGHWSVWLSILGAVPVAGGGTFQDLLRQWFPGTSARQWAV